MTFQIAYRQTLKLHASNRQFSSCKSVWQSRGGGELAIDSGTWVAKAARGASALAIVPQLTFKTPTTALVERACSQTPAAMPRYELHCREEDVLIGRG